jgi:23S rRNA (cytidine1920-2'-O)/16S rRNA (cytidine1409-2'-O)-methyltransferase
MGEFVSRAGLKLEHALAAFNVSVAGCVCADLGSNTGGFVDCLLQRGAARVYAIDTGYGALDWKLRKDPRVVVMERTNAMHVTLPERVAIVTIDVAWTRQQHILPAARQLLAEGAEGAEGRVIALVKPHYEASRQMLKRGILQPEHLETVLESVRQDIARAGFELLAQTPSPIKGSQGNTESLVLLRPLSPII